ncbi:hypothetical protein F4813DRAFT_393778 [Daldinia decipiens]|uniref:uncharacterized protein n=1 Tax=Daldinia decipiens TaxID=326647 RepID=UPI0020C2ED0D|nr:uncharacterized protein F4813DRAFT_393778 [Daldinia decipiens]KAI1653330.1 hypothetical protein F4813DRAFT_393778 [Daldinia decipiens]
MRAAQILKAKSKAKDRASALKLSVKTDLPIEDPTSTIPTGMGFTQVASAPPRKVQFDTTNEVPSAPKASEAMMNSDWRNNRRKGSSAHLAVPATASVETTEFQKAGGKKAKKLTIDTALANEMTVRRYRDTPIDPDFIHSAPITKKDYETADNDSRPGSSEDVQYSSNDTTLSVVSPITNMSTIRLESLTPITSEGFRQFDIICNYGLDEESKFRSSNDTYGDKQGQNDMTVRAIPIVSAYNKKIEDPIFPIAAVKAIKHSKRFAHAGWDNIDQDLEKNWAMLQGPRTAGLPVEKLREEYESTCSSEAEIAKNQARFDALISKLQKSSANRINAQSVNDAKPSNSPKRLEENIPLNKPVSHNSGISGVSAKTSQSQGTTLNPKASEFQISPRSGINCQPDLRNYPLDHNHNVPFQQNGYKVTSSTDSGSSGTRSATAEDIEKIYAFMDDLKAQLTRIEAGSQQRPTMMETSPMAQLSHIQSIASQLGLSPILQGPSRDTLSIHSFGSGPGSWPGIQTIPNVQSYHNGNGAFIPPSPVHNTQAPSFHMGPPPMSCSPGLSAPPAIGYQGFTGPGNPSPLPLHAQAQIVYGPRPVRKPRGPQRPGDPVFTQQQLSYEEYLENKRASDRAYAMQCRDRQARRFHRQRAQPSAGSQMTAPPKEATAPQVMSIPQATTTGAAHGF